MQPHYHKLKSFEQCDYEIEYADGGSSLGVLLRDVVPLNFTNGLKQSPRLAIGLVFLLVFLDTLFRVLSSMGSVLSKYIVT